MGDRKLVAVSGATGNQGGAVARSLLARGHAVRAVTRRPSGTAALALRAVGARIVEADLEDRSSLAAAVDGVDAVFVVATPFERGVDAEFRQARNLIDAAALADVPHVVYSSVASAGRMTGVPHFESKHRVEEHLAASHLASTIVAPVMFFDMLLAPWALPGLAAGWIGSPLASDTPVQRIAVADIGAFVALVIEQPERFVGRRIEIAGESSSGSQLAAVLSRHVGREIRYVQTTMDQAGGNDLVKMYEFLERDGYQVDIGALRAEVPEIAWRNADEWARSVAWSLALARAELIS